MWSIYTGDNICEQLPTKEYWAKLEEILNFKYPYEKLSITYNPQLGFTDVWNDIDFYEEKNRHHPTQKPQKLIRRLIHASSNPNDIVLDPFMGGGSTAIACKDENRQFIGFEIDPDYHSSSIKRITNHGNAFLFHSESDVPCL
jgi:DNA modification methylase